MAEGGGEDDLDNPFSFKSYVKKKTQRQEDHDIDSDDIFSIPTAASRKKEKPSLVVEDDNGMTFVCRLLVFTSVTEVTLPISGEGDSLPGAKKKSNKGNPFSFKKFLDQKGPKTESLSAQRTPPVPNVSRNGAPTVSVPVLSPPVPGSPVRGHNVNPQAVVPPDFASDLPDFIQNHFSEDQSRKENERHQLPDFTLESQTARNNSNASIFSSRGGVEGGVRDRPVGVFAPDNVGSSEGVVDSTFSDDEDEAGQRSRHFDGLSLPDFLVDSAIPGAMAAQAGDSSKDSPTKRSPSGPTDAARLPELPPLGNTSVGTRSRSAQDDATITQLREENSRLKAQVAQMRQRTKDEDERVAGLEKELSRLRKKEAEETAVMERAVQQVEENLVATTTRAVQAETLVAKLKQDVKGLQAQVKALSAENEALNSGDKGLSDLRERTKYASEQLTSAAATAESNLRELLGGVEKLKVLGHVLSSFEKVTDVDDSQTPSDTTV
ncbi:hypothetical protein BaRGS_00025711 [Batillaria attramentaria]|uniref:Endosome-associated-trafficking regulator 1 n=1 Tax=Batillaria attramentaria TaxID=370345 RepID=A0ABD0K7C4_9CAEN